MPLIYLHNYVSHLIVSVADILWGILYKQSP